MIDLLADLDIFGVSPEGLGVSFEHTSHLSNSNYLLEKSELHQNEFKLSVVFGYVSHDPYNAYYKLVQFLDKAPYKLEYETPAGTWQREVRLKELSKTEIVTGDVMMENFTLSCFSPWYRNVESKYDPDIDTPGDGKIYIEYKSTAILKKLNAFAYSADGTEGFTTDYPNENLLEEIIPYNSGYFWTDTNDTNARADIRNNTLYLTTGQINRYVQHAVFSTPNKMSDSIKTKKPVVALQNLTEGSEYTLSARVKYIGAFGPKTKIVLGLISSKIGGAVTAMQATYYPSQSGVEKETTIHASVNIPAGFNTDTKSVYVTAILYSDATQDNAIGTAIVDNIKLEPGNKVTGATALPDVSTPNLFADMVPYSSTKMITFANGGDTTSSSALYSEQIIMKGDGESIGRSRMAFSHPDIWPIDLNPVEGLRNLKPGKQYTIGARFRMDTDPVATNKIWIQVVIQRKSTPSVPLLDAIVSGARLIKGQFYYLDGLTKIIPEDVYNDDLRSVTVKWIFDGPGQCTIDKLSMYEGDQRFANNGLPTYIGEREVTRDFLPNVNLVNKGDLHPYTDSSSTATVASFDSWLGDGQFTLTRTKGTNSGVYLMNKFTIKRNVEYTLHLEFRDAEYGLRNFLLYNPFNGNYTSSMTVDGEPSTTGFGKRATSDVYWLVDQNNTEEVDKNWHTAEVTFSLSDTATIEGVYGIIFQPDKGISTRPNHIEVKHVMLTEGPYPGYYTQEERPEFYQWSRLEGKWTPHTPDGRDYNLTYDNEVFDYDYYQAPATRGPGMHAYAYDYTYEGWANGANGVFSINNESVYMNTQSGSPVEIFIDGPSKNPYWEVVRNGEILASDGFNITIAEGYRLVVSSVPGEQRAELIAPDGTKSNVYQQQRLELTNFVKVPSGYSQLIFHNTKSVSFNLREEKVVV